MAIKAQKIEGDVIVVSEIKMQRMRLNIIGQSPLVPHAVSAKAKGQLLFPAPKKNAAEKATSMKHEPYEEFLEAAYKFSDSDNAATRLYMPGSSFHSALANVAIDMVGAKKAQIGRLTTVLQGKVPVWGAPQIWATIVRSSDMARTPDVRVLPILPEWATTVEIEFVGSLIKDTSIANLMAAAGVIVGIGDGRPEKGKLAMGRFRLCADDDVEFLAIKRSGGQRQQDAALLEPQPYDIETEQLLAWFKTELTRRSAAPATSPRKKGAQEKASVFVGSSGNGKSNQRAETRPDETGRDTT